MTASLDDWTRFLAPVAAAVKGSPNRQDFMARCSACASSLDIPPAWLTEARRREAMARFEFWPSVAEISGLFADDRQHARFLAERRALSPPRPEPREKTPEAIAHVRAVVAALKTDLRAKASAMPSAPEERPTPRHLTPAQLLAVYERDAASGNQAAAARAAQLRQQMDAALAAKAAQRAGEARQ